MAPPVTPTASLPRPDASGSTNQAGPSQNIGQQAPSGLANMEHPVPVLGAGADANSNLQQRQNTNQQPDDVLLPGQYTPIPAPLPFAVSSSPAQSEQGSTTTPQPRTKPGFKTRVTIAISGCPASGKSTLAYLLAAVFEGATIRDTGFAGAQTLYPQYNGRVEENPNTKGPITKVIVIHQNSYIKPIEKWPIVEWTEPYSYIPAMEAMNPQIGAAHALAEERGQRVFERYWEEAYKANIGIDPSLVSNPSGSSFPQIVSPAPIRISKEGPNLDCRGAIAWTKFGKAINDGMRGHKNEEGALETEDGRDRIASYLAQLHPKTSIPLVDSRKIDPLRARIREWIREETAQNDRIGFPGRSVVDGNLRQIFILDGSLLFLRTDPNKGAGGERLMKTCDVKLFLPTLEKEAIQRCFSQREYMDPPRGTRKPEQTWMYEGYFSEVAWKEYLREHAWLFQNGDATNQGIKTTAATYHHGIHVRDFYASNLEEKGHKYEGKIWADVTLDWAVRTILFQLSVEVSSVPWLVPKWYLTNGFGRQAFFTKKISDAVGRREVAAEGTGREGASGAKDEVKK